MRVDRRNRTPEAKKLVNDMVAQSRRVNRKKEKMEIVICEKGDSLFTLRSCPHCRGKFNDGDVTFVSQDLKTIIHAKCVLQLAEMVKVVNDVGITDVQTANFLALRDQIAEHGI